MATRKRATRGADYKASQDFAAELRAMDLVDYIPAVSPWLTRPDHFGPICELFQRAYQGRIFATIAAPVQHGKTELVAHAIPYLLNKYLGKPRIIFATYAQRYAESIARRCRNTYEGGGGNIDQGFNTIAEWHTVVVKPDGGADKSVSGQTGFMLTTSVDGAATGYAADIVFIDDPYKNREEAEDPQHREAVKEWLKSVIMTRLSPNASVFIIASRWHEDDLSGWAVKEMGFTELRLAAVNDDGADPSRPLAPADWHEHPESVDPRCALAPTGPDPDNPRDLVFLAEQRRGRNGLGGVGEYNWASLFQGKPRPRAGAMFQDATLYHDGPEVELASDEL